MKYHAKKNTIDTMTRYERLSIEKLRKIDINKIRNINKLEDYDMKNIEKIKNILKCKNYEECLKKGESVTPTAIEHKYANSVIPKQPWDDEEKEDDDNVNVVVIGIPK